MTIFGHAKTVLEGRGAAPESQRCVCFTETPLEQIHLLTSEIDGRAFHFEAYGIAITKRQGRERGVNPVWYVDMTPGHPWLTKNLDNLRDKALSGETFSDPDVEAILPFIEHMGSGTRRAGGDYQKEFWWEREWRHPKDFSLPAQYLGLCPEEEISQFAHITKEQDLDIRFVDPTWSLEQIIALLARFPRSAVELGS